jgi:hypothetical protein
LQTESADTILQKRRKSLYPFNWVDFLENENSNESMMIRLTYEEAILLKKEYEDCENANFSEEDDVFFKIDAGYLRIKMYDLKEFMKDFVTKYKFEIKAEFFN